MIVFFELFFEVINQLQAALFPVDILNITFVDILNISIECAANSAFLISYVSIILYGKTFVVMVP